uniref:Fibronectin type-III domain-containing protein n=1 Tax=Xenopus tropicalis TaxID=8364 RepID=A0A1B8Y245_XENTR
MIPILTWLLIIIFLQDGSTFQVALTQDNCLVISLESPDVLSTKSVYLVKITGESKNYFFQFEEFNSTLPSPLVFNATYHGLYYIITLIAVNSNMASRSIKSITVLTKPLPVSHVVIHDYRPSPQTGVVFEVQYPEKFNVFSRVNISYWEGSHFRTVLYKDFFKGKTVFNHWLPGTCYGNITLQLVSEASFNKSTLVEYSGVGHRPQFHRTVPFPPRNISVQILRLNLSFTDLLNGKNNEDSLKKYQDFTEPESSAEMFEDQNERSTFPSLYNSTDPQYKNNTLPEATSQPFWWANETLPPDTDGFVNGVLPDYEDPPVGSSVPNSSSLSFKLLISWLPPKAPTAYDGFNIYIFRDGNASAVTAVDESAHEFVAEMREPGKYWVEITSFSSTGSCEIRESSAAKAISFYISPAGDRLGEMSEKPRDVAVKIVNSTTAVVSWAPSPNTSPIVSVVLADLPQAEGEPEAGKTLLQRDPAPIRTLFAVNKTQTSVTLLWVEEGIADYFEVSCWQNREPGAETNQKDPVAVFSHIVTISSLQPDTSYNCSVTSISHRTPSAPTFLTVSTLVAELNPNVVVISVLALLSVLLIALLFLMLIVLRRKHLQMSRSDVSIGKRGISETASITPKSAHTAQGSY